jgi:ABC-type sugar transport system permease subunit
MPITRPTYRLALILAIASTLLMLWMIAALGVIGPGGRQDLLYVGVAAVAVVGSALARLRPAGMARAMAATVAALVVVAVVALVAGLQDLEGASVAEILGITAMYVALFGTAGWLFRRSVSSPRRA